MAPWVHAFHNSMHVRLPCALSPPQNSDADMMTEKFSDYQNSKKLKSMRKSMLAGVMPTNCQMCDRKYQNQAHTNVYKDFFNQLYHDKYNMAIEDTKEDGSIDLLPMSFDYRFDNTCNLKCRHCTSLYSSMIEDEEKKNNMDHAPLYYSIDNGKTTQKFSDRIIDNKKERRQNLANEIIKSHDAGRLRNLHWSGGESLFTQEHWDVMNYIVETGRCDDISVVYVSNISLLEFKGNKLIDLLKNFKTVKIQSSAEAGGITYNYLRSNASWDSYTNNFKQVINSFGGNTEEKWIRPGLTITNFTLFGLEDYLRFLIEQKTTISGISLLIGSDVNTQTLYLDTKILGSYKTQWLDSFSAVFNKYRQYLDNGTINQFDAIINKLRNQTNFSNSSISLKDNLDYVKKIDAIRGPIDTNYILNSNKDFNFMLDWWQSINTDKLIPVYSRVSYQG
jgi:hypothetical protein